MRELFRNPFFHLLWLILEGSFLGIMVRDANGVDLVRKSQITLFGGEPFPVRYVPSVIFRHYPWIGIGVSIMLSLLVATIISLAAIAAVNAIARRFRNFHRHAPEEATECPPVTHSIPPPPPTSPP